VLSALAETSPETAAALSSAGATLASAAADAGAAEDASLLELSLEQAPMSDETASTDTTPAIERLLRVLNICVLSMTVRNCMTALPATVGSRFSAS
jgi:hypothetical protein